MLGLNFNLFPSHKSNPSALPTIGPGTEIAVETLCYGKQIGTIQFISDSPYCNEPGLQRAYVIGNGWTDYVLLEEIAPDAPDFELEDDPEYMQYLFDLEQAERDGMDGAFPRPIPTKPLRAARPPFTLSI